VVEKGVFVASLYRVAEEVFAAGVAECDKLTISLDAFWADWSHVVVAYAFSNFPL
jgi:hypothetical protein